MNHSPPSLRGDPLQSFLCCFPLRFLLKGCAVIESIVCENEYLVCGFRITRRSTGCVCRFEIRVSGLPTQPQSRLLSQWLCPATVIWAASMRVVGLCQRRPSPPWL